MVLGPHIIQYYNIHKITILQGTGNNNNNNKNYKIYLPRRPCTLCGKMTHKKNLEMSQDQFLRAPRIQIARSHIY